MSSSLLEPLNPAAGVLAQARLEILVLPDRAQHEAHALGLGAREEYDAVTDHAVAQQDRSLIEKHEIEPLARHLAPQRGGQAPDRILDRGGAFYALIVEQYREVDVALAPPGTARPASVQIGQPHRGIGGQAPAETLAEAAECFLAGTFSHVRPSFERLVVPGSRHDKSRIGVSGNGCKAKDRARCRTGDGEKAGSGHSLGRRVRLLAEEAHPGPGQHLAKLGADGEETYQ